MPAARRKAPPLALRPPACPPCPLALLRVRATVLTCARLSLSCAKRGAVWSSPLTSRLRSGPPYRRSRESNYSHGRRRRWPYVSHSGWVGYQCLSARDNELGSHPGSASSPGTESCQAGSSLGMLRPVGKAGEGRGYIVLPRNLAFRVKDEATLFSLPKVTLGV